MQNKLILIGAAVTVVVVGVLAFFSGDTSFPTNKETSSEKGEIVAATTVPFTKLVQGVKSSVATRVNYLITTESDLRSVWKMIDATGVPPTVDFKTHSVLAVFAGKESVSAISIAAIEDSTARTVSITLTKPESGCVQKVAAASPYEFVIVPSTSIPVTHKDFSTTVACK